MADSREQSTTILCTAHLELFRFFGGKTMTDSRKKSTTKQTITGIVKKLLLTTTLALSLTTGFTLSPQPALAVNTWMSPRPILAGNVPSKVKKAKDKLKKKFSKHNKVNRDVGAEARSANREMMRLEQGDHQNPNHRGSSSNHRR